MRPLHDPAKLLGGIPSPCPCGEGKNFFRLLLFPGALLGLMLLAVIFRPGMAAVQPAGPTVVLAAPASPYHALAEEIAAEEGLPLAASLREALAGSPAYLLWVAAPQEFSDPVMIELGQALKAHPTPVAVGIITGSELEKARQLWQRAGRVNGKTVVVANAASSTANISAGITVFQGQTQNHLPLSRENLAASLQQADYLTFNGHGSGSCWIVDQNGPVRLAAQDIPALPPAVISADSCQMLRIWVPDSLALRFVDQGAAAYAGFVYSPIAGYQLGEYGGTVFRYTWPEFTIGQAMLVQQEGYRRGFSNLPFYFLLGDPRISLQSQAPYRLLEDRMEGRARLVRFSAAPQGFLPVRIPGGAEYSYVEILGAAAADDHDPFYNSQMQMTNIGGDKYILFKHTGGEFTVRLQPRQPILRMAGDPLLDILDHSLIFIHQGAAQTAVLVLVQGLFSLVVLRLNLAGFRRWLRVVVITGWVAAIVHGLYALLRENQLTITSKVVQFSPLVLLITFLAVTTGAYLYLSTQTPWKKALAVLAATWIYLAAALVNLAAPAAINIITGTRFGGAIYNYRPGTMILIAFVLLFILVGAAYQMIEEKSH